MDGLGWDDEGEGGLNPSDPDNFNLDIEPGSFFNFETSNEFGKFEFDLEPNEVNFEDLPTFEDVNFEDVVFDDYEDPFADIPINGKDWRFMDSGDVDEDKRGPFPDFEIAQEYVEGLYFLQWEIVYDADSDAWFVLIPELSG
jgi:hypothetical protein